MDGGAGQPGDGRGLVGHPFVDDQLAAHRAESAGTPVPFGVHAPAVAAVLVQVHRLQVRTDDEHRPRGTVVPFVHRQGEEPAGPRQVRADHDRAEFVPTRGAAVLVIERRAQERTAVVDGERRCLVSERRTAGLAVPLVQIERHVPAGLVRQPGHDLVRDQQFGHCHRVPPPASRPARRVPLRQSMERDAARHTAVAPTCPIRHPQWPRRRCCHARCQPRDVRARIRASPSTTRPSLLVRGAVWSPRSHSARISSSC